MKQTAISIWKMQLPVMKILIIFMISCSPGCKPKNNSHVTDAGEHPRLIITHSNLNDFKRKAKTTHKELFKLAIQSADDFLAREIPAMKNASNTYREIGETLPSLGLAYLMTNDKKYLEGAEKWINALLSVKSWNGSQNLGRCAWVTGIAQLYDWFYNNMDDEMREKIISRLKMETGIIIESASDKRPLSNHFLIETSAVGTVGLILPDGDPDKAGFSEQADTWTRYIIKNAPLDGSWGEGIQYWEYGLGYFLRYLECASSSGYRDYFTDYDWLKKTGRFLIHFSVPDNLTRVINFGDCGSDRYIPACLLYIPAGKYSDPVIQDYAMKIQSKSPQKFSWIDFLTFDSNLKPVDYRSREDEFHYFDDNGFVTMRSSWDEDATLVGFRCGPAPGNANQVKPERLSNKGYGPGHQHPDINNFVIYGHGTWLAMDPGYVHLKETRNSNTLLVNNKGQTGAGETWLDFMAFESREPAPKIILAESYPQYDYIIGDAGNIYVDEAALNHFERQLMFVKPDIIIIADILKCKKKSELSWLLHANEVATIKKSGLGYDIIKTEASLSVFPLLPANMSSVVSERMLNGSDVYGIADSSRSDALLRTIALNSTGNNTNYLVVLTVDKPGESRPVVIFSKQVISITKNNREIRVKYQSENLLHNKLLKLVE